MDRLELIKKITEHHKSEYASSPHDVSDEEIDIIINNDCECSRCNTSIFQLYDFPEISEGEVYCEDCYRDSFFDKCEICNDYFPSPTKPEEHRIVITKESIEEAHLDVKEGFYQILEYPFYYGDIVFGFSGFFEKSLKLLKQVDINKALHKEYPMMTDLCMSGNICDDCVEKYSTNKSATA